MTPSLKTTGIKFVLATGICSLLLGGAAWSQEAPPSPPAQKRIFDLGSTAQNKQASPAAGQEAPPTQSLEAPPEKARALLDQVKKSEQDRQIAVTQTEIDRLKEDQAKTESDSKALEKTIESTTGLTTDTSDHLAALTADSRRLEHELAVARAWINAEQLKIAGLHALADAQGKSLSALARRTEVAEARSHLRAVELEILQGGKQVPGEGREDSHTDLGKARKSLAIAESKAASDERIAQDAMKAATAKMTLAETKATVAQRLADNDLTLDQTAVAKPKAKAPAKSAEKPAPVAAPPKPTADTEASAKPTKNGVTKTKKTSTSATTPR